MSVAAIYLIVLKQSEVCTGSLFFSECIVLATYFPYHCKLRISQHVTNS